MSSFPPAARNALGIVSVAAAKILRRHQHRDVITLVVVEREGQPNERRIGEEEVLEVLVLGAPPTSLYRFTATVSLISQPTCAGSRLGREFRKAVTGVVVIYPLGPLCQVLNRLRSIVSGDLPRAAVLFVWLPLIALSYFGTLTIAAWFSPQAYNWRGSAISKLLYPGYDPRLHYVASLGVAVTGLLIIPLAGYIRQRLRRVSAMAADAGAFALELGAIGLVLAGLIVSHPAHGTSAFPRLHEILARTAAFGRRRHNRVLVVRCKRISGGGRPKSRGAPVAHFLEPDSVARFVYCSVASCRRRAHRLVEPNLSEARRPGALAFGILGVARIGRHVFIPVDCGAVFAGIGFAALTVSTRRASQRRYHDTARTTLSTVFSA